MSHASDVDGDTLSVSNLSANNGTITDNHDGTYTFTPGHDFSGNVELNYTVSDSHGATTAGTAHFDVNAVADSPNLSASNVTVDLNAGQAQTLSGTGGNDTLVGGSGNDVVSGGAGDDVLYGDGAGKVTVALNISDRLSDTDGSESLGSVTIGGVPDGASLSAGTHNADGTWTLTPAQLNGLSLTTTEGTDLHLSVTATSTEASNGSTASSTTSFDVHFTGSAAGNDVLDGGAGNDTLFGGAGNDTLSGGTGSDLLEGGDGNDVLNFSADGTWSGGYVSQNVGDTIHGGTNETYTITGDNVSQDVFRGGAGTDTLVMGSGNDAVFLDDGYSASPTGGGPRLEGIESIVAGDGNDVVDLTSNRYSYGDVTIDGGAGNDVLMGNQGNDVIDGGTGNDVLYGASGNDTLRGGDGADTLDGGWGSDTIDGGAGNDLGIIKGGQSAGDVYDGGSGTDTLRVDLSGSQYTAAVRAELQQFQSFIADPAHAGQSFHFNTLGVDAKNWESLKITVDGKDISLENAPTVTSTTAVSTEEDHSGAGRVSGTDQDVGDSVRYHLMDASGNQVDSLNTAHGTVTINSTTGEYTFTPNADAQSLRAGDVQTDSFKVVATDGTMSSAPTTVGVTITGSNDGAVITGTTTGSVGEDGSHSVTGTLNVADVDHGQAHVTAQTVQTDQGTFSIGENGQWTFQVNSANADVQALGANESMTKTFAVASADGTATQNVTVTITGANDSATISGTTTGRVGEDGNGTATGTLNVADVDHGQAHVTAQTVQTDQGTFSIGENGQWTFQVNSANADVQALGANESMTKTFAVASADGTATQNVTVTITGANDSATISGTTTGRVGEDGNGTATGTLNVADVDHGQAHVTAQTVQTDQGTFSIGENGQWTFQVNSANADVQALGANESMTKTFAVASADGTATQNVTVTINGANDSPTVSGAVSLGHTAEDNSVTFTKAQLLANAHDTDAHDTLSVTSLSSTHGSIVDNGNGTYTFTPTDNYSGHVDVNYTVSDGHGGTATGSAALDVDAVADKASVSVSIGAPVETPNGSFTVTNLDTTASAGYHNTYGYYVMDDNGNPTSGGVIWSDVHASPNASVTISGVDPDRVGFFVIPDGGSQNSTLHNGTALTFSKDSSGNWQASDSSGHVLSGTGAKVLFDKSSLNSDHLVHNEDASTVSGNQNWEDLAGGGDRDYNDVNMSVTWGTAAPTAMHAINVSANFPDMDGSESHSVKISGLPSGSTLYQNGVALVAGADGSYSINPSQLTGLSVKTPAGFSGDLNVNVTAVSVDGTSVASSSASATVHDDLSNHGPDAGDAASVTTTTSTAVSGQVVATDIDGDHLHFSLGTGNNGPQHGSVVLNPDGTFTYTPTGTYNGTDTFKVQIDDGHGGATTETVSVNVGRLNHGPVAGDDSRVDNVAQGPALSVSVGATVDDVHTTTTTTTVVTGNTVSWNGLDSMSDPTTATPTTTISGDLNTAINGSNNANVISVGRDNNASISTGSGDDQVTIGHSVNSGSSGSSGKIDLGNGTNALDVGSDVNASVSGGSGNDTVRVGGNLNSNIDLGNGDNRLQLGGDANGSISAGSGNDDVKIVGSLNSNIGLGSGDDDLQIGGYANGSIDAGSGNDRVLVARDLSAKVDLGAGDDYLEVKGNDWASIDAGSGNDTVKIGGAITSNVNMGAGDDHVTITGQNLWVTVSGGSGTDSIELTGVTKAQWDANTNGIKNYVKDFENIKFSDGQVIGDATAFQGTTTVTTTTTTHTYETPITVRATLNDRDGSETLSPVTIGNVPAGGHLELNGQALTPNADGSYTLNVSSGSPMTVTLVTDTPVTASSLNLTTTVSSTESHGGDVSVTTLVGAGSNAGETVVDDRIATGTDHKVTINASDLLANDTDADGDTLSIVSVGNAHHGTVSIDNAGHVTFTADSGFNGTTTFDYTVSDGHGGTDTATVSVFVQDPNHAPVIDAAHTTATLSVDNAHANTSNIGQVSATDVDGDTLTYSVLDGGSHHGSLFVDSNSGAFFYDADDTKWSGTDSFTVQVDDGNGGHATQTISVQVTGGSSGGSSDVGHAVGWGNGGGRDESWGANGSWEVDGSHSGHVTQATDDGTNWGSGWRGVDVGNGGHAGTGDSIDISSDNRHNEFYNGHSGDTLIGAGGNDYMSLQGADGRQHISGYDHIQLGDGDNVVLDMTTTNYDYGNLTVAGGTGHDVIWSASGDDLLVAGNGGNTIHGGAGNDTIVAGAGSDNLMGEDGNDTFLFDFGTGHDTVNGGAGANWTDTIDLSTNMHEGASITISSGGHDWTVASDGDHAATGTINLGQDKAGTITVHSHEGDQTIEFTNIEHVKF